MKILVCGDYIVDKYIYCDTTRVSPEAPVLIATVQLRNGEFHVETRAGGAGNVAASLRRLGADVIEVMGTGDHEVEKVRVVSRNQQILRLDHDWPQSPLRVDDIPPRNYDAAVLSDYGKGSLSKVQDIIGAVRFRTNLIAVDPYGDDYLKYKGVDLLKPNEEELRRVIGRWKSEEDLATKVRRLIDELDLMELLLTRGSEGMTLYTPTTEFHVPAEVQEVADVTSAGDAVLATYVVAKCMKYPSQVAMRYANKAAGIVVRHFGTYSVGYEEVFDD